MKQENQVKYLIEETDMDIVLDALDSLHEDMRWNNKNGDNVAPYSYNLKEVERLYYRFAKEADRIMGSDIFTESAIAVELLEFINIVRLKRKQLEKLLLTYFIREEIINDESFKIMVKSKSGFIEVFIDAISMVEGYESDEET